jgi:hypothetical protein
MWKKMGARGRKRERHLYKKGGLCSGWRVTVGCQSAAARNLTDYGLASFFQFFWFKKKEIYFFFGCYEEVCGWA